MAFVLKYFAIIRSFLPLFTFNSQDISNFTSDMYSSPSQTSHPGSATFLEFCFAYLLFLPAETFIMSAPGGDTTSSFFFSSVGWIMLCLCKSLLFMKNIVQLYMNCNTSEFLLSRTRKIIEFLRWMIGVEVKKNETHTKAVMQKSTFSGFFFFFNICVYVYIYMFICVKN